MCLVPHGSDTAVQTTLKTRSFTHGPWPVSAGSILECPAQGKGAGFNLFGEWHQTTRTDRFVRPVRRLVEKQCKSDGLYARHLDCRACAQCAPADRRGWRSDG